MKVMMLALVGMKRVKSSWAVAAAELVFSWGDEGKGIIGTATEGGVMVVVHEIADGLSGKLISPFEHQM